MMIDFVIPWVDGNDPLWQKEREKYLPAATADASAKRFRSWDNLKYWFRGVEKFAPWVQRIHFITYGHIPAWLNTHHEKLNIVKHVDYIPHEYLPTFNSRPIELNVHRIGDLSEQFVFFSDDMFLIKKMKPTHFFKNNLPRDHVRMVFLTQNRNGFFRNNLLNDVELINHNFNKKNVQKKNLGKWFNIKYGRSNLYNLIFFPFETFPGFSNHHLPQPFLKSTFEEIWRKDPVILDETSRRRFRDKRDIHQYAVRYWQLASGLFSPVNVSKYGKAYHLPSNLQMCLEAIEKPSSLMICINDAIDNDRDFESIKDQINKKLEHLFPNECSFELSQTKVK